MQGIKEKEKKEKTFCKFWLFIYIKMPFWAPENGKCFKIQVFENDTVIFFV